MFDMMSLELMRFRLNVLNEVMEEALQRPGIAEGEAELCHEVLAIIHCQEPDSEGKGNVTLYRCPRSLGCGKTSTVKEWDEATRIAFFTEDIGSIAEERSHCNYTCPKCHMTSWGMDVELD